MSAQEVSLITRQIDISENKSWARGKTYFCSFASADDVPLLSEYTLPDYLTPEIMKDDWFQPLS